MSQGTVKLRLMERIAIRCKRSAIEMGTRHSSISLDGRRGGNFTSPLARPRDLPPAFESTPRASSQCADLLRTMCGSRLAPQFGYWLTIHRHCCQSAEGGPARTLSRTPPVHSTRCASTTDNRPSTRVGFDA